MMNQEEFASLLADMELRERVLLGYMMMDESAPISVIVHYGFDRRVFFFAETRCVFVCMEEMFNQGVPITPSSVYEYMATTNRLREINSIHSINDYLLSKQYIEQQNSDYCLEYLLNLVAAQSEYREMYMCTNRYDYSIVSEGNDDLSDM